MPNVGIAATKIKIRKKGKNTLKNRTERGVFVCCERKKWMCITISIVNIIRGI